MVFGIGSAGVVEDRDRGHDSASDRLQRQAVDKLVSIQLRPCKDSAWKARSSVHSHSLDDVD